MTFWTLVEKMHGILRCRYPLFSFKGSVFFLSSLGIAILSPPLERRMIRLSCRASSVNLTWLGPQICDAAITNLPCSPASSWDQWPKASTTLGTSAFFSHSYSIRMESWNISRGSWAWQLSTTPHTSDLLRSLRKESASAKSRFCEKFKHRCSFNPFLSKVHADSHFCIF